MSPSSEQSLSLGVRGDHVLGDGLLPSMSSPLPANKMPGTLPLFSPSEERSEASTIDPLIDTNTAFADALPGDHSLPTPPLPRKPHNLRLPSFDMLGIAVPHPDQFSSNLDKVALQALGAPTPVSRADDGSITLGTGGGGLQLSHQQITNNSISSEVRPQDPSLSCLQSPEFLTPPSEDAIRAWNVSGNTLSVFDDQIPEVPHEEEPTSGGHSEDTSSVLHAIPTSRTSGELEKDDTWLDEVIKAISKLP